MTSRSTVPAQALVLGEIDPVEENIYLKEQLTSAMRLLGQLAGSSVSEITEDHIYVYTERRWQKVYFKDISWIQAERNYVFIYTEKGYLTVHQPISKIEELLPKNLFPRIHKSFIVALRKVDYVLKDAVGVKRNLDVKSIPLGARFKKNLLQEVEQRMAGKNGVAY